MSTFSSSATRGGCFFSVVFSGSLAKGRGRAWGFICIRFRVVQYLLLRLKGVMLFDER